MGDDSRKSIDGLAGDIAQIVRQFHGVRRRAHDLGLFTGDRELLQCPRCGLSEDVAVSGRLTTFQKDDETFSDTGLRFHELTKTRFCCPQCSAVVEIPEGEEDGFR